MPPKPVHKPALSSAMAAESWVDSSPAIVDGTVYFGSNDSRLYALDADDGELTRTRKVRRKFVNERYHDLIQDLYDPAKKTHALDIEIRYEDGRISAFKGNVVIEEVSP